MFDKTLKAVLLLAPILYTTGLPVQNCSLIAFSIYVLALFIASMFSKPQRNVDFKVFAWLLTLCSLNLFWHTFNQIVLSAVMNLMFAIFAITLIVRYCKDYESCYPYIIWAGVINIAVFIGQYFGYDPLISNPIGEPGGIMGNAPRMCAYLAVTIAIAFRVNPIFYLLFIGVGVLSKEYLVAVNALIIWGFKVWDWQKWHSRKAILYLPLLFGIIAVIFIHDSIFNSLRIRWIVWGPTIEMIFQRSLTGWGLGVFPHVSTQFIKVPYYGGDGGWFLAEYTYNSYMQLIFGLGLGGALWIAYALRGFIKRFRVTNEQLSIVCILVVACFEYPFEIPKLWPTLIAIISFYLISINRR